MSKRPAKTTRPPSSSADRTLAYAEAVLNGEIVAGPHVRNACRRHIDDLKRKDLFFDHADATWVFEFFEDVLKLSEGQFEGNPFKLHISQAFILGSIFGWKKRNGTRRFRRAYIEQGKGNGKSPLAGGIGLYGLVGDKEAGAQIYAAASKQDQATILFHDACKMARQSPAMMDNISFSGTPGREFNLAYLKTGSFFRPVSREAGKSGSGPRPHFILADEIHEMLDSRILEILERGFKFRREPLLLMITNSGSDRNTIAWEEHEHGIKVAAGNPDAKDEDAEYLGEVIPELDSDSTFAFICGLDPDDDPLNDPSCWIKANPLLGVILTEEYLAGVVAQARAMPSKLNNILRLHFCVWTDAETAWMTRAFLEPCLHDFDPEIEHIGKDVSTGVDLSATQDLTVQAYATITGLTDDGKPNYDVWIEAWTPEETLSARALNDKVDYERWAREGHLLTTPGRLVDFRHVAARLADAASIFAINPVAYDRYAYRRFQNECEDLGLTLEHVEHPQGGTKRGKPTEAMIRSAKLAKREPEGLWMPASVKLVEEAILEGRIRFRRNPVLVSAIMSAVPEHDAWGNYWLAKRKSVNRIDAIVAICMAVGAATLAKPVERSYQMLVFEGGSA